jgi:hypothetical protein
MRLDAGKWYRFFLKGSAWSARRLALLVRKGLLIHEGDMERLCNDSGRQGRCSFRAQVEPGFPSESAKLPGLIERIEEL